MKGKMNKTQPNLSYPTSSFVMKENPRTKNFPRFGDLPAEIRLIVWDYALSSERRAIIIGYSTEYNNTHTIVKAPIPPLLHVNKETHKEALKKYTLDLSPLIGSPVPLLMDPSCDILVLSNRLALHILLVPSAVLQPYREHSTSKWSLEYCVMRDAVREQVLQQTQYLVLRLADPGIYDVDYADLHRPDSASNHDCFSMFMKTNHLLLTDPPGSLCNCYETEKLLAFRGLKFIGFAGEFRCSGLLHYFYYKTSARIMWDRVWEWRKMVFKQENPGAEWIAPTTPEFAVLDTEFSESSMCTDELVGHLGSETILEIMLAVTPKVIQDTSWMEEKYHADFPGWYRIPEF
jgi:hypothetical protein